MRKLLPILAALLAVVPALATTAPGDSGTVYVVATSHLDTQWRWTIQTTIAEYIRNTLHDNFALLEKYPDYVFNFEGAFRYQLMQEYYPAEYARMKKYVKQDRWRVCGSWVDAVDVNMPAPESLMRHVLYGNGFFAREFGKRSVDVFLPDCFGFGYVLPSVMAHCGLTGFSSQKLTWGSAYGVPFDLGVWRGVDGSEVVAALNPGAYDNDLTTDASRDSTVLAAIDRTVKAGGPPVAMKYYGTGDIGGSPSEASVKLLEQSLASDGPVHVVSAGADQLFRELTPAQVAGLPRYDGELVMTSHGAGCYTSEAAMKRWNRHNEVLADAAERAATLAWWLGGKEYPHAELERAWTRFLWHQFHDDLTGTSIPEAYTFSWNDELLSQQEFAQILTDAVGAISRGLDTNVKGTPLIVFNPLSFARTELVTVPGRGSVTDAGDRQVPTQVVGDQTVFAATVPANSIAVFTLDPSRSPMSPGRPAIPPRWDAESGILENSCYRLKMSEAGLVSLFDKQLDRELLAAPPRLQLLRDEPLKWAAWEVDYDDLMTAPYAEVPLGGVPASVEIGDAFARLTFRHEVAGSTIIETLTLGGDGLSRPRANDIAARLEWDLDIDWRTPATLLKAAFFTTARDTQATYDLGLGVIRRGLNRPALYEVPAQRWADVTDASGAFGLTIMNDSRHGWDRPDAGTIRLSLIHTPAVNDRWKFVDDQKSMDLGRHHLKLGMMGHGPNWHPDAPRQADALNQPLLAFVCNEKHAGPWGRKISLLDLRSRQGADNPQVAIRAIKKSEDGDWLVVRLQETSGKPATEVVITPLAPARRFRELRGDEVRIPAGKDVRLEGGALICDLKPFQPRTFAIELASPPANRRLDLPRSRPLDLPWNLDGISAAGRPTDGDVDGHGRSLPSEVIPPEFVRDGVEYRTGPRKPGQANLVACRGQVLKLPSTPFDQVQLLVCSVDGPTTVEFKWPGGPALRAGISDGTIPFGQWDSRVAGTEVFHDPADLVPAYVMDGDLGWIVTHRHDASGQDEPYVYTHFYRVTIPREHGETALQLPDAPQVLILAASLTNAADSPLRPNPALLDRPRDPSLAIATDRRVFVDSLRVELTTPHPDARIRYRLDGGDVGNDSPRYDQPILLTTSCELTAQVTRDTAGAASTTRRATFTRVEPWPVDPAAPGADLAPGLAVRGYEGLWLALPDFDALAPTTRLTGEPVAIPESMRAEDIGLVLEGWLVAPARGVYRLYLASDDGSRLWLDGRLLIDNDGLHGASEAWVDAPLERGPHRLRIDYFQHLGGRDLELKWAGPGIAKQTIPLGALGHQP